MNLTPVKVQAWFETFSLHYEKINFLMTDVVIAPSFVHLDLVKNILVQKKLTNIKLASQAVSEFESGAYTSQISATQIKDFCEYAIVGHSETKTPNESKLHMAAKCQENMITPIICYTNLNEVPSELKKYEFLAWEDPNNISSNGVYKPKDPKEIEAEVNKFGTKVIYGGSVNEKNISDLSVIENIKGYLVGNASLSPDNFYEIIAHC